MHITFDSPPTAIAVLDKIRLALVETTDLARIKALRDEVESVRQYAVTTALGLEMYNQAMEVKLMVEPRGGEPCRRIRRSRKRRDRRGLAR